MKSAFLIHRVSAGSGNLSRRFLETLLRKHGYEPRYHCLEEGPVDLRTAQSDLIAIAGGDGTLGKLLPQLRNWGGGEFAILPSGTANNVARSMGILDLDDALHVDAVTSPFNIGQYFCGGKTKLFCESVGIGALASMIKKSSGPAFGQEKLRRGREHLAEMIAEMVPFYLQVETEGGSFEGDFLAVEFLNAGIAGPSLPLSPNATPTRAQFDIYSIRAAQRNAFIAWLRSDLNCPAPGIHKFTSYAAFECKNNHDLRVDDQIVGPSGAKRKVEIKFDSLHINTKVPR